MKTLAILLLMVVSVNCLNAVYTVPPRGRDAGHIGSQVGKGFADAFTQSFNQSYNDAYQESIRRQREQREFEEYERRLKLQYQEELRLQKEMANYLRDLDQKNNQGK